MSDKRAMPMLLKVMIGVFILVIIGGVWNFFRKRNEASDPSREMLSAVTSVREVLRVTSVEGERAVPVTYSGKNGTNAFGIGYYRYRISYDIDSLKWYRSGDSLLLIRLPEETVRILEDEQRGGFRVIDVWRTGLLGGVLSPSFTGAEENAMKQMATNRLLQILENDGTILRARDEALSTVSEMFALTIIGGRVVVLPPLSRETSGYPPLSHQDASPLSLPKEYVTEP